MRKEYPMDLKTKELLAISAAYAGNCERCLRYHIQHGLEAGLTEKEILIAVRIADRVKQTANSFLDDVVSQATKESPIPEANADGGGDRDGG